MVGPIWANQWANQFRWPRSGPTKLAYEGRALRQSTTQIEAPPLLPPRPGVNNLHQLTKNVGAYSSLAFSQSQLSSLELERSDLLPEQITQSHFLRIEYYAITRPLQPFLCVGSGWYATIYLSHNHNVSSMYVFNLSGQSSIHHHPRNRKYKQTINNHQMGR